MGVCVYVVNESERGSVCAAVVYELWVGVHAG